MCGNEKTIWVVIQEIVDRLMTLDNNQRVRAMKTAVAFFDEAHERKDP